MPDDVGEGLASSGRNEQPRIRLFALFAAVMIGLGALLRRPSLSAGWFLDDYVQHSLLSGNMWFRRGMWEMHVVARGNDALELIDKGVLPWWAEPTMVFAPLRPLTSLLMWWEYQSFGKDAVALHAVSFALWALLAALAAAAYARTLPSRALYVAAVVFVLSPVHSESVSWVASQSLLVSAVLGTLSLNFYIAFRASGAIWQGALYTLFYGLSLLGGENGLCFVGYFLSWEIFSCRGSMRVRALGLAPAVLISALYLAWSTAGGYGTRGVTYYVDVLSSPAHLWQTLTGSVPAHIVRGLVGSVFRPDQPGMMGWALLLLLLTGGLLWATGLVGRHGPIGATGRAALSWGGGALISVIPYGVASYSERLGAIPELGFAAVIGILVVALIDRLRKCTFRRPSTWVLSFALAYLVMVHVAVAGYQSHATADYLASGYRALADRAKRAPVDAKDGSVPEHVFVLSSLHVPVAQTTGLARAAMGRSYALWRVLSPAPGPHFLVRTGRRSFILRATTAGIFVNPSALVYRRADSAMKEGTVIETEELDVRVHGTGNAGPFEMEFTFDDPLESPRYRFIVETSNGFETFGFPPAGERVIVPPSLPPARLRLR